jgi:hypothetical protein
MGGIGGWGYFINWRVRILTDLPVQILQLLQNPVEDQLTGLLYGDLLGKLLPSQVRVDPRCWLMSSLHQSCCG